MKLACLIALCGCNDLFGLHRAEPLDAADTRLLRPTPAAACPAAPDLASWKLAPRAYAGVNGNAIHPSFLDDATVVFAYQEKLYSGTLDQPPAILTGIDDQTGARLAAPSAAPGGELFWYTRYTNLGGGLAYAKHDATGWSSHLATFPVIGYSLEPGPAAFYAGDVRMVVAVQPDSAGMWELRELASPDGDTWTDRGSLGFDTKGGLDPALSIDGCILLYTIAQTTLFVAYRQPDGSFAPPAQLLASTGYAISQPVISPDRSMIWINSDQGAFQLTP